MSSLRKSISFYKRLVKELCLAYDSKEEELESKINKKSFTLLPSCVPVKVFVSTQEKEVENSCYVNMRK